MKRIAIAALILAFTACSTETSLAPTDPSEAGSGGMFAKELRSTGGTCTTAIEFLSPEPGQPPNVQRLGLQYACQLRGVGQLTASGIQIVTFNQTGSSDLVNAMTYTDANGNQLFASFVGTATPPDQSLNLSFVGVETYAGGTGRFANADGALSLRGHASLISAVGSFETKGTLRF